MNAVTEEVCPKKKVVFNAVSLSSSTITRRFEEIGANVYAQLQQKTAERIWLFFISTGWEHRRAGHSAAAHFIHGIRANFEMCKELAALQSLKGTTMGGGVFSAKCAKP